MSHYYFDQTAEIILAHMEERDGSFDFCIMYIIDFQCWNHVRRGPEGPTSADGMSQGALPLSMWAPGHLPSPEASWDFV